MAHPTILRMRMTGVGGGDAELLVDATGDAIPLHVFGDGVEAALHAVFQQIPVDVGGSVTAVGFGVGQSNGRDDLVPSDG